MTPYSEPKMFPKWLLILFTLLASFAREDGRAESLDNWHGTNSFPQDHSLRVSQGNGLFVAMGEFGDIYTSSDQATWTSRYSGTNHMLYDTAYGGNIFVAVGANGTILTSPDGVSWTLRHSGTSYDLSGVTYGGNTFVAVGDNGAILTSPDGAIWTIRDSGTHQFLKKVAFGRSAFVAVGENGTILLSGDGETWTANAKGTSSRHIEGITYGNGIFVAVGDTILASPDGINWNEKFQKTNHHFSGVAFGNGTFAAVADKGTILTSSEGSEWTQKATETRSTLLAIAYGAGNFVASGEQGTLLLSASLPSPKISVSSTSLNFGSVNVGSSSSQNLTITNSGSADLVIHRLTTEGANVTDFITQNDHCTGTTLLTSGNCTVQLVFSPHSGGSKSATLSISSNDPANPTITVPLTGNGGALIIDSTGGYCFIATAVKGSDFEDHLSLLRKFRNVFLLKSKPGKALVAIYYRYSPPLANFITKHDFLKGFARLGLVPLVVVSYAALYTFPDEKFFLFALMSGAVLVRFILLHRSRSLR